MEYTKMLGLLAVAAAALMAFAGTASATLTEATGDPVDVGDTIHASSGGATSLTGTITITCQKSTITGEVTSNGVTTASGPINSLTFEECGNHTVTVKNTGSLSVETVKSGEGTVRSTGAEVTVLLHSIFLGTVHCIYTTSGTDIGVLTEGSTWNATLDINSVSIPRTTTDGACGEHSTWEGGYTVSTPDTLLID